MALKKLLADLSIISKLGTNPGIDDGLSEEQLKAKFDEAANIIKDYLNNYLILEIEKTVDVETLLSGILDVTLSKVDKAANAAATGEAIRGLRSFFDKVVHGGDYVLESDGSLAAEISGPSTIRIMGGEGVIQGNLFSLNLGTYEDVELLDGTYGLYRNDLIVVRCTKDESNALTYALVGLTGAKTSGEPVDPEYITGDINGEDLTHDFPLYRVKFDGYDMSIEPLFFASDKYSFSVNASEWGDTAPYTQTVCVPGLRDNQKIRVYPSYGDDTDANITMHEACACVSYAKRYGQNVTFTCLEDKPSVDINIIAEVYV